MHFSLNWIILSTRYLVNPQIILGKYEIFYSKQLEKMSQVFWYWSFVPPKKCGYATLLQKSCLDPSWGLKKLRFLRDSVSRHLALVLVKARRRLRLQSRTRYYTLTHMSKQYDSYALFFRCRPTTPPQFKQLWKLVLRKLLSWPPSLSLPRSASCHKLSTTQLSFNVCNQKMWSHHECKAKEDKFIYHGLKWQASDCWGFCLSTSWKTIFASRQCHTPRPFSTASKQVIWASRGH